MPLMLLRQCLYNENDQLRGYRRKGIDEMGKCDKHQKVHCPYCFHGDAEWPIVPESAAGYRQVDLLVIPQEILDLVRFLADTWAEVDAFVYENCTGEQLAKYPVVQGTRNQMDLRKIGKQKYDSKKIRSAVDFLLAG